ncbi:MAG: sodium/solute symporter, partial [Pirellulaceae bacterium]|nr:sodium/solute symporter [Pirellulaceae bacterium]
CIFPLLVAAFLFMPFLWMAGVFTIPEYLGRRYNSHVRSIFALLWTCFMVGTLGIIFVSAAEMASELLGWKIGVGKHEVDWHFWVLVVATALVVGFYTTIGGLKAVVVTDSLSCFVLIIGAALICILGLVQTGGISGLQEKIAGLDWTEHHFSLLRPADDPDYPWPAVLLGLGFVLGPAYWIGNQAIVQRTLGTKSQAQARASYLCCAAIKLVFPVLLVVPGLIGLALFHDSIGSPDAEGWQGNRVLPMMVVELLPTGVLGIVMGAFLAGVLSNLDSYVNSASTLVVTDLYKPVAPDKPDSHYLAVGRWLTVVFLAGGVMVSYLVKVHFATVFEAFQTILSFFQGPLLALLLLGMLTSRVTQWGGLFGMLIGVGTAVMMHCARFVLTSSWVADHAPAALLESAKSQVGSWWMLGFTPDLKISFLWVAWWSFAAAIVATVVISLCTKPYSRERLAGLVCWIPSEKEAAE